MTGIKDNTKCKEKKNCNKVLSKKHGIKTVRAPRWGSEWWKRMWSEQGQIEFWRPFSTASYGVIAIPAGDWELITDLGRDGADCP